MAGIDRACDVAVREVAAVYGVTEAVAREALERAAEVEADVVLRGEGSGVPVGLIQER